MDCTLEGIDNPDEEPRLLIWENVPQAIMSIIFLHYEGGSRFIAYINLGIPSVQIAMSLLLYRPVRAFAIPAIAMKLEVAIRKPDYLLAQHLWREVLLAATIDVIVWASPSTGHAGARNGQRRVENKNFIVAWKHFPRVGRGVGGPGRLPDPSFHEVHFTPFWGHVEELTRNALPSGQRGRITVPARHFFTESLLLPGTGIAKMPPERLCWPILGLCWPICGLCWGHVRPSWGYVEAMLPHLGPLLDHVVGDVGPSGTPRGVFGLCCFHGFTFIPKILLEKALPSGLRGTHSIFATPFL